MTDRFYPRGKPSAEDVWKTSYEVQNEMRSFQRSSYPPGYSGHEPGARDKYGYSTPGPDPGRLAAGHLALREEIDIQEPRRIHAVPRMQETDERRTFHKHDVPEMERSYRSPLATMTAGGLGLTKVRSSPTLGRSTTLRQTRLSQPERPVSRLENDDFSYFVPRGMQNESEHKLMGTTYGAQLSKLHKSPEKKVNLPLEGTGTGFRTSCPDGEWWPRAERLHDEPSSYTDYFKKHPFFRMSPYANPSELH